MNPMDRLKEQQAQRLLEILQSDLRAQMRAERDEFGRNGVRAASNPRERLKKRITKLSDPRERQRIWNADPLPMYQDEPVQSLPKTRAFWSQVNVHSWCKKELSAACALLDFPTGGKKLELIARIQDWVYEPEIIRQREEQQRLERQKDAVLASGRVFGFGANFNGELGLGHRQACPVATEIEGLRGMHITKVLSGFDANFAFAIAEDGRVFAWGGGGKAFFDTTRPTDAANGRDQLNTCFLFPRELPELTEEQITHIACGRTDGHIGLITVEGKCFTWGRGEYTELGVEGAKSQNTIAERSLAQVQSLQSVQVTHISVGNCHTAAITNKGKLYTWGWCWSGQLGLGETKRAGVKDKKLQHYFPSPTVVETLHRKCITRVSCGALHTAVVSSDGQLFTFGCGDGGRLGLGTNADSLHPELVVALERDLVLDVCCASWHSLCLVRVPDGSSQKKTRETTNPDQHRQEGYVYAFGSGLHGQLGLGKQPIAALPTRVPDLYHRKIRCYAIAASSYHSCALSVDGEVFTWGLNTSGCLGRKLLDGVTESADPDVIDKAAFLTDPSAAYGVGKVISIASGQGFTLLATGPWGPKQKQSKEQFFTQEKLNRNRKFMHN